MSVRACDIMSSPAVTISPDATLREALSLFERRRISGAPVVGAEGKPLGMFTRSDLLRALDAAPDAAAMAAVLARRVGDLMTRRTISVPEDAPLGDVAQAMAGERVHRVLVLREGTLVGIVSAFDLAIALSSMAAGLEEGAAD